MSSSDRPPPDLAQLPFAKLHAALRAAGEASRLRVLALLAEAELTVSDLTEILRQSQPLAGASHLNEMRAAWGSELPYAADQ